MAHHSHGSEHSGSTSTEQYEKDSATAHDNSQTEEAIETEHDVELAPPNSTAQPNIHPDGSDLEKSVTNRSAKSKLSGFAKVKSNVPSVNDLKTIPNGGTKAWLQVLGAFFLFFNSWGIINTFGVYQTYYETNFLASSTSSDISWIGSVQAFCLIFIGPLTGPIYDAGYFRLLIIVGSVLVVFGQMMLSLSSEYYQIFLAQAITVGLGAGCLFIPSVAILSQYFSTKLATATGLAAAGSSLGGVIYPIVLYKLIPQVGFAWATRILGFMSLATLIVSNLVMEVRALPPAKRKIVDLPAFKELPYTFFVAGCFLAFMGLYAPFFYVEFYSISYKITNENLAFYTLAIINSASVFGRIVPNFIADKVGPLNIIIPACFISGIICLCLIPVRTVGPLIVVCLLYGFFSGALVSLPPTIYVHLSIKNRAMIGTRMGQGFFIISIGLLLGTPICGWILNGASYAYVWVFSGLLLIAGAIVMFLSRTAKVGGLKLMTKA